MSNTPGIVILIIVFLVIYYTSVIIIEKNKKNHPITTQVEINNPKNKKKVITWAIIGFIIGIPAIFVVFLILTPLFVFLGLGASGSSDSGKLIINYIMSAPVILTPILGAIIGWKLAKRNMK